MDRQTLLEQKRQRLQELRLRRSEASGVPPGPNLGSPPPQLTHKDVATQTDTAPILSTRYSPPQSAAVPERTTFDKGIQVDAIPAVSEPKKSVSEPKKPVSQPVHPPKKASAPKPVPVPEPTRLQRLLAEEIPHEAPSDDSEHALPFNIDTLFKTAVERPVLMVDFSPHHPRLMVVAYAHTKSSKTRQRAPVPRLTLVSSGLAIVYDLKESPAAEFFLNCTAPITFIAFSKTDSTKVVGGLEDGKVVIWDLATTEPATVAVLPLLSSTVVSALGVSGASKYIHHSGPIVAIEQIGGSNPTMVAVSEDGVVNVWSTSFLEFPKHSSVKLRNPSKDPITGLRNDLVVLSVLFLDRDALSSNDSASPEYRFLGRMVVGTQSGAIYKLANAENQIQRSYHDNIAGVHSDSVTCLGEMRSGASTDSNFVLSSHLGWSLKVWDLNKDSPIAVVPTLFLVNEIALHPKQKSQFITVGTFNKSLVRPVVHFWDMEAKFMGPVCEIAVPNTDSNNLTYATAAKFTAEGTKVAVAFNDGTLAVWNIDVLALNKIIRANKNPDVDGGLPKLV